MRCKVAQCAAAALLAAGLTCFFLLLPDLSAPIWIPVLLAAAAAASAAAAAEKKTAWAVKAGWMLASAAVLMAARSGLAALADGYLSLWQRVFPRIYPTYAASVGSDGETAAFLSAAAVLVGLWSAAYVRRPRGISFGVCAALLAICVLLLAPTVTAWGLILAALVLLLLHTVYFGGSGGAVRVWSRVAVVVLLAAALGVGSKDDPSPWIASLRYRLTESVQTLRFGDNHAAGLTDGDLTSAGVRQQSGETMLTVTMSHPDSYYLRGFVGEVYDGSHWLAADSKTLAENADAFYWLHSDGFYGQTQLAQAAQTAASGVLTGENRVEIANSGASSRYLYAPYETLTGSGVPDANAIGDETLYAAAWRGQRSYTLSATNGIAAQYGRIVAGLAADTEDNAAYLADEAVYNRYVYENGTELPMAVRSYLQEKMGDYITEEGQTHFDYKKAKQNILFYLTTYITYNENVSAAEEGVDFVLNFLDGTQAGYDVHYATAAAMMFRYYGIPARYVEGFLITKDEAAAMTDGETTVLDGTHGHAWVEYYQDGVGWLPFEVTPGYFSAMEQAEDYRDISGLVGHTPREKTAENLDDNTPEDGDSASLLNFWLKYRLRILLMLSVAAVVALMGLFILWLVRQRQKTARRKAAFMSDDIPKAIRGIYLYMMDVLLAQGLPLRNCPPGEYAEEVDADLRQEYLAAAALWQEAKFSGHTMTEEQRRRILALKDEVWARAWSKAGPLQRLRLKYVLFL